MDLVYSCLSLGIGHPLLLDPSVVASSSSGRCSVLGGTYYFLGCLLFFVYLFIYLYRLALRCNTPVACTDPTHACHVCVRFLVCDIQRHASPT